MIQRWFTGGVVSITGLVLAAVLFVSVNLLAGTVLTGVRIDLTRDGLYTLSPGTRAVLGRIDEPVTLRFYFSERLGREIPSYAIYANRVRDMLQEFAAAAAGRLRLEFFNPEPFSDVEDRAVAFGLQGVPIDQSGEQVYFGLAGTNSTDDVAAIGFFQAERDRFLEYDLAKMVYNLSNPKKPVVGLSSTLPINGDIRAMMAGMRGLADPWFVMRQIDQLFEVRHLGPSPKEIDDEIDVLVLVHPAQLSEQSLYAIDQFLLNGGRALIFVDPYSEAQAARPPTQAPPPNASDLARLFDAWGIELAEGKLVGDLRYARSVNAGTATRIERARYLAWLSIDGAAINRDDPVTSDIGLLNVASAGMLRRRDDSPVTLTPLVTSSTEAMALDASAVQGRPDIRGLLRNFKADGESHVIAARLSGIVKTAFPDGPPKPQAAEADADKAEAGTEPEPEPEPAAGPGPDQLVQSATPLNLVVVADTDLLVDHAWVQVQEFFGQQVAFPLANNGDFVVNAIDNLAGSSDLISLRSRGTVTRPFQRVERMQREAELRLRGKEQELLDKLQATEKKLAELQTTKQGGGAAILSDEQHQAILDFRQEQLEIRRQLRAVQHDLRRDIEGLETVLAFANIGLVPILVGCVAVGLGLWRASRRRRRARLA
jgi:ABC-type uncharacterized transport system involved in gliding motility auxiliary subunit